MSEQHVSAFEKATQENAESTLLGEMWSFPRHNKKYWWLPILIVLVLFGADPVVQHWASRGQILCRGVVQNVSRCR